MVWNSPLGASPGTYSAELAVASAGWARTLSWNGGAATFAVTASITPTPTPGITPTPTPGITPTPTPAPIPSGALTPIHVQGNRLVNALGQPVVLRGVNRSGMEYACVQGWGLSDGPMDQASVAAIKSWHANVVRVPLNEQWRDTQADSVAAWTCWRDGGTCPGVSFQVAGMQTLLNAVRATGATNVVALGGVGYANSLSRWVAYKPADPLNNLMAAWHVY